MSLAEILAARRERSVGRIKPEHREKQERHIAELRASGLLERAAATGDRAPAFLLSNARGEVTTSVELLARGPLIVSFFRGKWCPYCVAELEALDEIVPELRVLGGNLVAITPERAARTLDLIEQKGFGFDILIDRGNVVAQQFGVAYTFPDYLRELYADVLKHDLAAHNDDPVWKLPMPARFVIDSNGIIREAKVDPDYRQRPEPSDSLELVRQLQTAPSNVLRSA
jgi:peroxiredoxin